ncbi:ankyrin repeat domain-containing protein [Legionella taurinensis]|nr:ankyrin repeat domain-containing protein [Legionella taurinensis]MDX1836674.1 ankyrin repeat domain-containing protein [Legionella taurinensis]STY26655.1 ankyrin repeat-containing protein [Legionella taurinensis]
MPKHSINTGKPHRISQIDIDHANGQCHFIVSGPKLSPDIKLDEMQAEVIEHLQRVFGGLYDPKAFKIEFKPTRVEFRYTITNKTTLLLAFLKLAKYSTYLNRINEACINDIHQFIASEPKKKPASNPDIEFETGLRSQRHFHAHGEESDIIEYKSKKYRFCTGSIDFAATDFKRVASVGHNREIILLDPDSDQMQELYRAFEKPLTSLGENLSLEEVFSLARRFSNYKIDNTDFDWDTKTRNTVKLGKEEKSLPLYTLEEIIEQRKGVCRHHALFTAFLLGQYIKKQSIADTSIHHCRDNWVHPRKTEPVAHTWVVCKQNNTLYLIDSMWNVQFNLTDYTDYSKACKAYTKAVINRTLSRAHLNPPVQAELAPPPKPALAMEAPKDPVSEKTKQLKDQLDLLEKADGEVIKRLIAQGADVNVQGSKGWTAAHCAARKDDRQLILFLKEKKADFNLKSANRQRSPLFYAQNRDMIKLLVDCGADPFQEDGTPQQVTPLRKHEKIISADDLLRCEIDKVNGANLDLIKRLIAAGADVNAQGEDTGWTAAHLAADKNDAALLQLLIEKKADFNLKSGKRGLSPLFYAQTPAMVLQLVTNGANLLQEDAISTTTPLKELLEKRIVTADELLKNELDKQKAANSEVIKALVKAGADVNTQGKSGWTAVHYAAQRDDGDLLLFLVKKKANLNLRSTSRGRSPLFYAHKSQTADFLIEQGANLLQKDNTALTALQALLARNIFSADELLNKELEKRHHANPAIIKALIAAGATINLQGEKSGWTAVHCATQWDDAPLIEFLIERNADLNLKSTTSQSSPLFYARSVRVVALLLNHQADYMQANVKQPAYQALIAKPALNSTKVKRLLLSHELKKTGFNSIRHEFLAQCTPQDYAPQVKLLHALGCFIEDQIQRLGDLSRFTKGKDDKTTLYRSLMNEIRDTLEKGKLGNNDTIKNLLYQAATISHHRRYRTSNKAAAFFSAGCYKVEAKSWELYKEWVSSFNKADSENPFQDFLSDSTAIRKNRLAITLPNEHGGVTKVNGYDEYRSKKLKP